MTLNDLKVGESATILSVDALKELRHHFLDMGLTPETTVTLTKVAPMGDPLELNVRGYELTLRSDDAKKIVVVKTECPVSDDKPSIDEVDNDSDHPHIGESGIYHDKSEKIVIPEEKRVVFALAGNQNCGKKTLFNTL